MEMADPALPAFLTCPGCYWLLCKDDSGEAFGCSLLFGEQADVSSSMLVDIICDAKKHTVCDQR